MILPGRHWVNEDTVDWFEGLYSRIMDGLRRSDTLCVFLTRIAFIP
jgi:hypothetical protein